MLFGFLSILGRNRNEVKKITNKDFTVPFPGRKTCLGLLVFKPAFLQDHTGTLVRSTDETMVNVLL